MKVITALQAIALLNALSQATHLTHAAQMTQAAELVSASDAVAAVSAQQAVSTISSVASEDLDNATLGSAYLTETQIAQLSDFIMDKEGYRGSMYYDERGAQAIGYGRNIDRSKNGGLTEEEARDLMISKVKYFEKLLVRNAPWTKNLDQTRFGALLNMSFQLGVGSASRGTGVLGFRTSMNYIRNGSYSAAARSLLGSKWAQQTPNRAKRIAKQIETGTWQIQGRYRPTSDMYANLFEQLRVDEGYKPYAYKDSLGYWTLGIGILIDPKKGGTINSADAKALVLSHVRDLDRQFASAYRWYTSLDAGRKGGLIAYAYKLSFATLKNFKKALDAMANRDFDRAARELLDSSFGRQAPTKARAYANLVKQANMPTFALSASVPETFADETEEAVAIIPELETAMWEDAAPLGVDQDTKELRF